jgi:hypothetical protein
MTAGPWACYARCRYFGEKTYPKTRRIAATTNLFHGSRTGRSALLGDVEMLRNVLKWAGMVLGGFIGLLAVTFVVLYIMGGVKWNQIQGPTMFPS